jgi:hypothetical protein
MKGIVLFALVVAAGGCGAALRATRARPVPSEAAPVVLESHALRTVGYGSCINCCGGKIVVARP